MADDLSSEHLTWLVDSRSKNQKATLDLYLVIENNKNAIETNVQFAKLAQDLAAIAFSLWRAVFLSDLTKDVEKQMIDVRKFLGTLISHNTINYQQDRGSREWTFQYYLDNARSRLLAIAGDERLGILKKEEVNIEADSAKQDWMIAHNALTNAVARLPKIISQSSQSGGPSA